MTTAPHQSTRRFFREILRVTAASLALSLVGLPAYAALSPSLVDDAQATLQRLCAHHPAAQTLAQSARAILVFPRIVRAGLVADGSYGEGVLTRNDKVLDHYNSVASRWDWPAGAESCSYVLFLMSDEALKYLMASRAWDFGTGPSLVVLSAGVAQLRAPVLPQGDAYALVLDPQGGVASPGLEGTRISRIKR